MRGFLVASLLGLLALAASGSAVADPRVEPLVGYWVIDRPQAEEAAMQAEIERATADMSFVFRGVARAIMTRGMEPEPRFAIHLEGGDLFIGWGDDAPERVDLSGEAQVNEDAVLRSGVVDGALERAWRHDEETHGVSRWVVSEGGDWLVIHQTLHNPRFTDVVRYAISYRRGDPPEGLDAR